MRDYIETFIPTHFRDSLRETLRNIEITTDDEVRTYNVGKLVGLVNWLSELKTAEEHNEKQS